MVLYIYIAHLMELEWERFGRFRVLGAGESQRLWDYLRTWELDVAFEHLRLLTFSDAMLQNLHVYLLVGTPVAATIFVLERDRVRWLQALADARLPGEQARRASWWLKLYLRMVSMLLVMILSIAPFHLGMPRAHYICTACALFFGSTSIFTYLTALGHLDSVLAATSGEEDGDLVAWTRRVRRWVRPALKLVFCLHFVAAAAGALKAESLGDDRSALAFGILETLLVLGYQLFQGVFVVDDMVVGRAVFSSATAHTKGELVAPAKEERPLEETVRERLLGS